MSDVAKPSKTGGLRLYSTNSEKQAAFRARQIARGMQMIWVSRQQLAAVRAMEAAAIGGAK